MDTIGPLRAPGMVSARAMSSVIQSITPNPSLLVQYPIFFTMARVTVHRHLSLKENGRQMPAVQASVLHGFDIYQKYGIWSLYRGLPVFMGHSFANALLAHPIKRIRSRRLAASARVVADAATYPLLLACTRMAAYTTGDSQWGFMDCIRNTIEVDGWRGLWSGALPYLLVTAYKELEEIGFKILKSSYPRLDEADSAILGFLRIGLGAVVTSPFLTMSTILRCQSNNPALLTPTSFGQVFRNMPWRWNLLALSIVAALGAVNIALIHDKHASNEVEDVRGDEREKVEEITE